MRLDLSEIPTGEPILPPSLDYAHLSFTRLVNADEKAGTTPQRPVSEEQGDAGAGSGGVPAHLSMVESTTSSDLVKDPILSADKIKLFQDNMKECQEFLTVSCFIVYLSY